MSNSQCNAVFDRPDGDRKLTGMLLSAVYWRTYFREILPPGANGIIVILENTCNQQYTYRIDGVEAKFLGHGDLHDTKYNDLESVADFEEINADEVSEDLQGANCQYRVRVFPSQEFEDDRTTSKPALYALALALVFFFTSAVFILYDYCVERRQKVIMKSAQQSGALVSSLFPEAVRSKLYEDQDAKKAENTKQGDERWKTSDANPEGKAALRAAANANLYPDATVLFADIAGFTKWSSSRSPIEVFELLETIYGAFDKIANRRGVFKIETIGDCYVATTGLPNAQPDHAVIMAKFANDCMNKLRELIHGDLIERLGEDTGLLAMRFGFHSGPVTAGVLRCERSRFQIFGDSGKKQDASLYHDDCKRPGLLTFLFILLIQSTQRQEWNPTEYVIGSRYRRLRPSC
jgi:class 3 adenylate cyclase